MPYPNIHHELPPELQPAVQYQQRVGWQQLYYGRVARQWAHAIDLLHPDIAPSGRQILTQFTQEVWKAILSIWATRNQHLHQDAGCLSLPDYQQAIRTMYEQQDQIPPEAAAALFQRPLQQMLELPPALMRPWIEWANKYMLQQSKAAKKRAKLNTPDIRSYFPRTNHSANDLHPP